MNKPPAPCPCGGKDYARCCQPYHQGAAAPDAESLMRSRYSAFVLRLEGYLLASWHPSTRPATLDLAEDATQWIGLAVVQHQPLPADRATVEFVARYKVNGRAYRHHEISRFVREGAHWYYLDGETPDEEH